MLRDTGLEGIRRTVQGPTGFRSGRSKELRNFEFGAGKSYRVTGQRSLGPKMNLSEGTSVLANRLRGDKPAPDDLASTQVPPHEAGFFVVNLLRKLGHRKSEAPLQPATHIALLPPTISSTLARSP